MQPQLALDEAILAAMKSLGGDQSIARVTDWIEERYPNRWKDIGTTMADLTHPPNNSTRFTPDRHFLKRVGHGVYRLRSGW